MNQSSATIPADVRERIIAAAADLFEQSGRQAMPTVDAVRRSARVDMNAASAVMKEWRRASSADRTGHAGRCDCARGHTASQQRGLGDDLAARAGAGE